MREEERKRGSRKRGCRKRNKNGEKKIQKVRERDRREGVSE